MGLYEGTNYTYPYNQHISNQFIPLTKIESDDNNSIAEKIYEVFRAANAPMMDNLMSSITELIDNVFYHSQKDYGTGSGYVCAQVYKSRQNPRLVVSVRDIGIGIVGSYQQRKSDDRDGLEIFRKSFEELNSSTEDPYRGLGLSHAVEFIKGCSGFFSINSGPYQAIIPQEGYLAISQLSTEKVGTEIHMEVPFGNY